MSWLKDVYETIYASKFMNTRNVSPYTKHHIESFNRFVSHDIHEIIAQYNPIKVEQTKTSPKVRAEISFHNVNIKEPECKQPSGNSVVKLFPNECRKMDKSYLMTVYAHYSLKLWEQQGDGIETKVVDIDSKRDKKEPILLAQIPCMIKSEKCTLWMLDRAGLEANKEDPNEFGGYFIVNGKEYCIIAQENKAENFIYKTISPPGNYIVYMQCKVTNKYDYPFFTIVRMTRSDIAKLKNHTGEEFIYVSVSNSKKYGIWVPLSVMFRAMGVVTDKEIFELIIGDSDRILEDKLEPSLRFKPVDPVSGKIVMTQEDALLWIAKQLKRSDMDANKLISLISYEWFEKQMFPHLGGQTQMKSKIYLLAHMVRIAIGMSLGIETPSDNYHYGNKRILVSGVLYGQLFKYFYQHEVSSFRQEITKILTSYTSGADYSGLITKFKGKHLQNIAKNISTGFFPTGGKNATSKREGVSQLLERRSIKDTLSYLNRVITPIPKDSGGKSMGLHQLHQSHFGFIDPADTPDSSKIGIIKHFTVLAEISTFEDPKIYYEMFNRGDFPEVKKISDIHPSSLKHCVKIIINGDLAFVCPKDMINIIAKNLREKRRNGINRQSSIYCDYKSFIIEIRTDAGRIMRPLLIMHDNKLKLTREIAEALSENAITWDDLFTGGYYSIIDSNGIQKRINFEPVMEYVDINETKNLLIAKNPNIGETLQTYTHCEIDDSIIFGFNSLSIPCANHNPGPRILFQDGMQKQSAGIYVANYQHRMDKSVLVMPRIERPLITAIGDALIPLAPSGKNIYIAITPYSGYNQEDSIIINQHSIDSGMFDIYNYKLYTSTIDQDEIFMKPNPSETMSMKYSSYEHLENNGRPKIGSVLKKDDIIIGKVRLLSKSERQQKKTNYQYVDKSITYNEFDNGVVEQVFSTENAKGEIVTKIKVRIFRQLIVGDKLACYDDKTEVLTNNGWKLFKDLSYRDMIATYIPETQAIQYSSVHKIVIYDYIRKPMVHFKNWQVDLLVTPNHRMWLRNINKRTGLKTKYFVQTADRCVEQAFDVLTSAKTYNAPNENDRYTLWYDALEIKGLLNYENYRLPIWVWSLNKHKSQLLVTLITKDVNDGREVVIKKYNEALFGDFQRLAVHACYQSLYYADNDGHHIKFYLESNKSVPIESYQSNIEQYEGKVYCVQVNSGLIVVRRNYKVVICGNSRASQKGTVSIILPRHELPFTNEGIIPDLIFNPHGIISRMTMNHMIEILASAIPARQASTLNLSSFGGLDIRRDLEPLLKELGFNDMGEKDMYDATTGRKMQAKIYCGFIYYQRLKHLVNDKMFARATGARSKKTKQPLSGKARGGGLRIGLMESQAFQSHGLAALLKESFYDNSDHFEAFINTKSGLIVPGNEKRAYFGGDDVAKIKICWMSLYLVYLLMCLGIACRFQTERDEDVN